MQLNGEEVLPQLFLPTLTRKVLDSPGGANRANAALSSTEVFFAS